MSLGSFFTSARLIYVAGKEGYLPAMFGRLNKTLRTPLNAMCLQAALTIMFIVIGGGFRKLINFAVVGTYAFDVACELSSKTPVKLLGHSIFLP